MNVNYLDIGLVCFLLGFGTVGYIVGFTEKVFSILSWAASTIITYYTYDWARPWVLQWIEKPPIASMVTAIGLFLIYLALFSLLSKGIHERIEKSMFKKADKYLGVLLGLASGYVVLILAALICRTVVPSNQYPAWSEDSILWNSAEKGGDFLEKFLPLSKPTTTFFHKAHPKILEKKSRAPSKKIPTKKSGYSEQDQQELNSLVKEYT